VLAAYFCKIYIRLAASRMQISFGWSPATCQIDKFGYLFQSATSRMNEICIQLATDRMKFASGWRPTE
jgi:hypothetical protein